MKMKIGIDARFYGAKNKGLGRYTEKLIQELEKIDKKNHYFIFLRKDNYSDYHPSNKNFQKVLADFPWYSLKEQIFFPRLLYKLQCDLVHFLHFNVPLMYKRSFIVTIHDLTLFHFPTHKNSTHNWLWYKIKYKTYHWMMKKIIQKAQKIITISNFTANDIKKYFGNKIAGKIKVIYEAPSIFIKKEKFSYLKKKYAIKIPYLLYVGNAYPHKNLERLVDAFQIFKKQFPQYSLVLVGKNDFFYQRLKKYIKLKKIDSIIIVDTLTDKELKTIYQKADLFIFPSLYEGFGLPPLEAMAENLPVISSQHGCMQEILGESVVYFNGKDVDNMVEVMINVIKNVKLRNKLKEKGKEQIKKYNWKKTALDTFKVYSGFKKNEK